MRPLIAAIAISVVGLAPAVAQAGDEIVAPRYASLKGEAAEPAVLTIAGVERECTEVEVKGSVLGRRTLEVLPIYDQCMTKAFGGLPAKGVLYSCTFIVHLGGRADPRHWNATADLQCPWDYTLEFHDYETVGRYEAGSALCTFGIAEQTDLASVTLTNLGGSPSEMAVDFDLRQMKYRAYGSELFCGSQFGVLKEDGAYAGTLRLAAFGAFEKQGDLELRG